MNSAPAPAAQPLLRTRTMKAAVVVEPRRVEIIEAPVPICGSRQILVRVEACGVCASNLPRWEGRTWFQYPGEPGEMGHEGFGRIVEVGEDVQGWRAGDAVCILSNHAYAEFDVADADHAVRVPRDLEDEKLPGEALACAWNIFQRSLIEAGNIVAIVGAGFLGVLLAQLAANAGARVIVCARRPLNRAVSEALGSLEVVIADDVDTAVGEFVRLTHGRLCDVAIEATGKQRPLDVAARLIRERGRLVVAGFHQDGSRAVDMQLWNWRGLDVINAHERALEVYVAGMRRAFAAVQEGLMEPRPLITHRLPLGQLGEAFELLRQRPAGFVKAIVRP